MNEFYKRHKEEIDQILAKYPSGVVGAVSPAGVQGGPNYRRSAVMPLLYIAQRERGYVSREDLASIGELLGVSATEVGSVAGFYSLYYEEPHGRYHIQVCNDLPCALRGADEFLQQVCAYLGIGIGETTPDGLFTVEAVKCLAACHRAPMFQVQGDGDIVYHEHQTIETAIAWIEEVRSANEGQGLQGRGG